MLAEGVDADEGMDVDEGSSKTDFDAVKTYIETVIIKQNKVVSMKVLQTVYSDSSSDKRYCHKLKQRISKELPDLLQFVQPSKIYPEVVSSKSMFDNTTLPEFDPQSNIASVGKQLRQDIISYCNSVSEHKWPPTFETVTAEYGSPPESVKLFLKNLLTTEKTNREKACCIVDSMKSDFVNNTTHGKVINPKPKTMFICIRASQSNGEKTSSCYS